MTNQKGHIYTHTPYTFIITAIICNYFTLYRLDLDTIIQFVPLTDLITFIFIRNFIRKIYTILYQEIFIFRVIANDKGSRGLIGHR